MNIDETKLRQIISRLKSGNEETAKELEALLPLSFPEPPAGYTWHNGLNCTPEQVEIDKGWRLVTKEEPFPKEWEFWDTSQFIDGLSIDRGRKEVNAYDTYRTKLPLPTPFQFIVGQKYTTRSEGPTEVVEVNPHGRFRAKVLNKGIIMNYYGNGKCYGFKEYDLLSVYVPPKKRRVPLGPEDVQIGSVLRRKDDKEELECGVYQRNKWRVWAGTKDYEYGVLVDNFEIKFPNSTWQPAWKEIEE